jgi:hypothetical protein
MVCNTSNDRQKWILILQRAAANCPADSNDGMILLKSRINYLTLTIFVLSADAVQRGESHRTEKKMFLIRKKTVTLSRKLTMIYMK